ncbi:MAG: 50S ribosomal protein L10 [Candidatus Nanohaloarchaeota archaeon QJJ-7]|nr:50S ribosomal protein L10 [Candidatus Nanohaloarchaeota archaeon QJJ-7]
MQLTRQEKEEMVERLENKMEDYPVVGMLDMHSLPARQLQEIKKELVGEAEIRMTRKTLIDLALEGVEKENIEELGENDARQPALIFTEKNPFSLFKLIQDKKSSAAASGGEEAPSDIVVESGMTDLDPGPMLGKIQEIGAGTSVEDGKIKVENDAVAVEAGEVIDSDTAEILNALDMEPLEVGLDLKLVYENGEVFDRGVLEIDTDEYREKIEMATGQAFNLAVNAGHLTDRTAPSVVSTAVSDALALAINAGILVDEVVEDVVRKAAGTASSVDAELDLESIDMGGDEGATEEEPDEENETGEDVEEDVEDEGDTEEEEAEDKKEEETEEDVDAEEEQEEEDEDNDAEETEDNDEKEVN